MKEPRKVRDHTPGWNPSRAQAPSAGFDLHPATVTGSATERTGTAEDVERLARELMGWRRGVEVLEGPEVTARLVPTPWRRLVSGGGLVLEPVRLSRP